MIKDLFRIVDHELGPIQTDVSGENVEPEPSDWWEAWCGKLEKLGESLMANLARESFGILGETLFQHSTLETIPGPTGPRGMFNVRYRPNRDYFRTLRKPLPKPMDPKGCDAVGVELGLALLRGIEGIAEIAAWIYAKKLPHGLGGSFYEQLAAGNIGLFVGNN